MDEVDNIFGAAMATAKEGVGGDTASPRPSVSGSPDASGEVGTDVIQTTPMTALASYVMSRFQENESFRRTSGVTDRLDYCIRSQKQVFTDHQMEVLSAKFGEDVAKRLFVPITSVKIRAARAMLIDLANQSGDPLFHIEPTPSPDIESDIEQRTAVELAGRIQAVFQKLAANGVQEIPPEIMQKMQLAIASSAENRYEEISNAEEHLAKVRAERMNKKVWDILVEGGWNKAFTEYLDYICTYGTGVVIGPVMRNVSKNKCVKNENGVVKYVRTVKSIPTFEAVNPCDCYPAPDAVDVDDGPLCIRVKYTADELARYEHKAKGDSLGNGWIGSQVGTILARHPKGGVKLNIGTFSHDRRYCENNGFDDVADCTFEGIRCFATVRGSELLSLGITKTRSLDSKNANVKADGFYRTESIVIDNRVVYCRIYSAQEELPVSKGVFYTLPGSWWGDSIAEKIAMCQCVLNNCIASLVSNMPASSGAIFWVNDVQRLANKSPNALKLKAGMTIPFLASAMGNQGAPIGSLSVPSNASDLLAVFQKIQTQADLDSGLPAYTEGQSAGQSGALRTASGLAIFTEASTRGLKMVMTTTDSQVISRVARLTADWVLLNDDDMNLKGDVEVKPVGLIGKVLKAQRDQQRMQLFKMVIDNPTLTQSIGIKGIMELFRPSLKDLDINPDSVIPSKAKMEELELVQSIQNVFQATQAANGVQQNAAGAMQQGQAPQGEGETSEPTPGSVAERRNVA